MQVGKEYLLRFLEGSNTHFVIPVYQRNYDWQKIHCEQLFNDLLSIIKNNFRSHFMGSIVSIYNDDSMKEYLIIDGQQRLTTISLCLLAIHDYIIENNIKTQIAIPEQIKEDYLINKYLEGDQKIRLKPVKNDKEAFQRLFDNNEENIENSNITKNYLYFKNRITNNKINPDKLYQALQKLVIVDIELSQKEDDPQLIFESLNSTGLNLSQSDLVRNYILMSEKTILQNKYYEIYWHKIEINTDYKVDNFLRDYLTYKTNIIPNKGNVYFKFKEYFDKLKEKDNFNMENELQELLKFSTYYKIIITSKSKNENISELLKEIRRLDITVSYPYLLETFELLENNSISIKQFKEILEIIISYIFRRTICDLPTNSLNKIFMVLGKDVKKHLKDNCSSDYTNYVEILKYILLNKKYTQRYPDDIEFRNKLNEKDIYNMQSKSKIHLLSLLENYDNKEKVDIEKMLDEKELSIEHIMPQKLSLKWKKDLGEDYESIHQKYLHKLGNLTLSAYNKELSNKSFSEKKYDNECGFNKSKLYLNSYVKSVDMWNKKQIKERAKLLTEKALKIWYYPVSAYKPVNQEESIDNRYSMEDDFDVTGTKIYQFEFWNEIYKVDSWKDFAEKLLSLLNEIDSALLLDIAKSSSNKISTDEKKLRRASKIADNIFFETNLSSSAIVSFLNEILSRYEIQESDIVMYIK